jgi:hypothetical protein
MREAQFTLVQAAAAFLQSMTHQQAPGKEEAPTGIGTS